MSELTSTVVADSPAFGQLNKAAELAADCEVLLTSHEPDAWKEPQLKAVGRELRQWVKGVRQPFGNLESRGVNAAPEDDGASPLNHMMAKLVTKCSLRTIAYKHTPQSESAKTFKRAHADGNSLDSKSKKTSDCCQTLH